jgi:predicted DNA-binding transcriptional regulator YafY
VLSLAVAAGVTCQVAHVVRAGQRARLTVEPLAVTDEGGVAYLRARSVSTGQERLIALDRIHGLRIVRPSRT